MLFLILEYIILIIIIMIFLVFNYIYIMHVLGILRMYAFLEINLQSFSIVKYYLNMKHTLIFVY